MWRTIKKQDIKHHKTDLIDTYRIMIARRFTNFATDAFIRVLVSLQAITHTCRFIQIFIYSLFILWFLISVLVWLLLSSDFFFFFYSSALVLFNSYQYQKQWTNKPFVMVFFLLALSLSHSHSPRVQNAKITKIKCHCRWRCASAVATDEHLQEEVEKIVPSVL